MRVLLAIGFAAAALGAEPPLDLIRRVAERESFSESVRGHYTYRQTVTIEEVGSGGGPSGQYREVREVTFTPAGERLEQIIGKPQMNLARLRLTEEDFRDLREIQPLLLTKERLFLYQCSHRGEQTFEGVPYFVLKVTPRQILDGQRLFEGFLYIDQKDYSIVRLEGRAVPQILGTRQENLFPQFTTIRQAVAEGVYFPVFTHADDTLPFRTGPLRMRMTIQYSNYQRFGSETKIEFDTKETRK
ncbi:MAG: hypothetical protein ACKV22_21060 [Bryobacteraceae bacterium]